jgi:signal transduction histidine kinase
VLREADDEAALSPQPGLAQLHGLVATMAGAGLPVELVIGEGCDRLPAGLELSIYRIVQEALTNTLKHAGPAHARVEIRRDASLLTIDIVDDGAGTGREPGAPAGHGLTGMRERVALFGGHLHAAPLPGGGFGVHARLPVPEAT